MKRSALLFIVFVFLLLANPIYSTIDLPDNVVINLPAAEKETHSIPMAELILDAVNKKLRIFIAIEKKKEKVIIVDPNKHTWRAFSREGKLIRTGMATAGKSWCPDIGQACKTKSGVFRVNSLGDAGCYSKKFPVGRGGAPMPYCMFFNGGQAIHGSHEVAAANLSHGCVRVHVEDARWLRFNFVNEGTKVIVKPY